MYIIFFLIWVIFNGQLTVEIALLGLVVSGAMYAFICRFMDYRPGKDLVEKNLSGRGSCSSLWNRHGAYVSGIRRIEMPDSGHGRRTKSNGTGENY